MLPELGMQMSGSALLACGEGCLADLGGFPDGARMLAILLHKRQNACRDDAMRSAKVVVDLCEVSTQNRAGPRLVGYARTLESECNGLLEFL